MHTFYIWPVTSSSSPLYFPYFPFSHRDMFECFGASLQLRVTPTTSPKWLERQKPDSFFLTGFKRSRFIFPLALHVSLNSLVMMVAVVGMLWLKHNWGWGLS